MPKKPCLKTPSKSQHVKGSQTLLKSKQQHFDNIFLSLRWKKCWKISLLVISELLRMLVSTLTANDKYCLCKNENLQQLIQIQLSQKENTFSQFFASFLKSTLNVEDFEKKDDPHSLCFFEITK